MAAALFPHAPPPAIAPLRSGAAGLVPRHRSAFPPAGVRLRDPPWPRSGAGGLLTCGPASPVGPGAHPGTGSAVVRGHSPSPAIGPQGKHHLRRLLLLHRGLCSSTFSAAREGLSFGCLGFFVGTPVKPGFSADGGRPRCTAVIKCVLFLTVQGVHSRTTERAQ